MSAWDFVPLLDCLAYVAGGRALVAFGLLKPGDGETAVKFASWFTAPSLVVQALCCQGRFAPWMSFATAAGLIYSGVCVGLSWLWFGRRHARERAVLTGCSVGSAVGLYAYPFVEVAFGIPGLQAAILFSVSSLLSVHLFSHLLFASAGAAYPEKYIHQDNGVYKGQWEGLSKEGFGQYKYPGGAVYEGEWKENQKTGRGVYTFPKGGMYEGEWLNGMREGVGVRTFSNGRVVAGRWHENKLVTPLEVWQCTRAVEGASDAASAARRVEVGGATALGAVQKFIAQPILWATILSAAVNLLNLSLPPSVDALTKPLAAAHCPLALFAAGATMEIIKPAYRQVRDITMVVGSRMIASFSLASCLMYFASSYFPQACYASAAVALAALSPPSMQIKYEARRFKLNESMAAGILSAGTLVSLASLFGLSTICVALRAFVRYSGFGPSFTVATGGLASLALPISIFMVIQYSKPRVRMVFRGTNDYPSNTPALGQSLPASSDPRASLTSPNQDFDFPGGGRSSTSTNADSCRWKISRHGSSRRFGGLFSQRRLGLSGMRGLGRMGVKESSRSFGVAKLF
ncbi:hypothetical protein BSKO_08596 [Bryopsis sp. KO-2023]|nr:hypothetical protein BSKO_08596 [Bryopsis sp. KO-2023]